MISSLVSWLIKTASLLLITLSLTGCLSNEEKQERKQDAFDISGEYSAQKTETSTLEASIKIVNVEGRHRVNIEMLRSSELSADEKALVERHGLDLVMAAEALVARKIAFASTGGYLDIESEGSGDNYSDDNGKTSKFGLCSGSLAAKGKPNQDGSKRVFYCIKGTAEKAAELVVKGQLLLVVETSKQAVDSQGHTYITQEYDEVSTVFITQGKGFHTQYMGRWSGEIITESNLYLSNFVGLEFALNEDKYYVYPLFRVMKSDGAVHVRRDVIELNGQAFKFTVVETSTEELDTKAYPVVRLVYKNEETGSRIVFVGTLWSQSDFSGNILLVTNDSEEELGAFRLARQ